ncbi:MAG: DMT family transporter [Staphylothermus sp.]|nr:DMT family transporter [Staphylothermus sp.]
MNEYYIIGIMAALSASMIWSFAPGLISKYGNKTKSTVLNTLRTYYASLLLLIYIIFTLNNRWILYEGIPIVVISAFFGPLLGDTLYIKSIKRIGGGNAISISYTYIFFAQLYSFILYNEKITTLMIMGTFVSLLGIYITYSGEKHRLLPRGLLYAIGTALSWGMGATLSKLALMYGDPVTIAFVRNLSTALILSIFTYKYLPMTLKLKEIQLTAFITGGLGFGVGMTLFLTAISLVGVGATVLATSLTPVLGRIIARLIAHEKPSKKAYLGTIITSLGIFIGLYPI